PALPLPTASHVTELITMLISLEMLIGRRTIWLPKIWLHFNVGKFLHGKITSRFVAVIEWFEKWSRRRLGNMLTKQWILSPLALIIFIFALAASVAFPFSGMDTLPSLGVMVISLGLILEDILFVLGGIALGALGIGLEIASGAALYAGFKH